MIYQQLKVMWQQEGDGVGVGARQEATDEPERTLAVVGGVTCKRSVDGFVFLEV